METFTKGAFGLEQIEYWRRDLMGFCDLDPLSKSLDSTLLNETFKSRCDQRFDQV